MGFHKLCSDNFTTLDSAEKITLMQIILLYAVYSTVYPIHIHIIKHLIYRKVYIYTGAGTPQILYMCCCDVFLWIFTKIHSKKHLKSDVLLGLSFPSSFVVFLYFSYLNVFLALLLCIITLIGCYGFYTFDKLFFS